MANDVSIFASAPLPAYLAQTNVEALNGDITAHASLSFPVLSLNGKRFTVIRGDEKKVVMNPLDPSSTAQYIDVVLVRVPKFTAKAYYSGTYSADNEEAQTPICFSSTGIIPDQGCAQPQSACCKTCPKNAWGSAVDAKGIAGKGKACRDAVRLAIAPRGSLKETMLLRVPPTSIKALGDYGSKLTKHNVPYMAAVTRIKFDPNETAQKLVFEPVGFLDEDQFRLVQEEHNDPTVMAITGETPDVLEHLKAYEEAVKNGVAPTAAPAPAPADKPKVSPVEAAVATGKITPEVVKEVVETKKEEVTQIASSDEVPGLEDFKF